MMSYEIFELTSKGKLFHGTATSLKAAMLKVEQLREESRTNPFEILPRLVLESPVEVDPITAQELYEQNHGANADLSAQPHSTQIIYKMLAEISTNILRGMIKGAAK